MICHSVDSFLTERALRSFFRAKNYTIVSTAMTVLLWNKLFYENMKNKNNS